MSPYEVLQISPSAGDSEIREAYIRKVKEYPPERFPEEFKKIREAYGVISTPRERVSYQLFHLEEPDAARLAKSLLSGGERKRVPPQRLIEMALNTYRKGTRG